MQPWGCAGTCGMGGLWAAGLGAEVVPGPGWAGQGLVACGALVAPFICQAGHSGVTWVGVQSWGCLGQGHPNTAASTSLWLLSGPHSDNSQVSAENPVHACTSNLCLVTAPCLCWQPHTQHECRIMGVVVAAWAWHTPWHNPPGSVGVVPWGKQLARAAVGHSSQCWGLQGPHGDGEWFLGPHNEVAAAVVLTLRHGHSWMSA